MHDDHSKTIGKLNDLNVLWKKKDTREPKQNNKNRAKLPMHE